VEDWEPVEAGFVYLDGNHTFCGTVSQIDKALSCEPQTIAAHDLWLPEVRRATDLILGEPQVQVESLGVWRFKA
jgi:hypothetical protein